MYTQTCYNICIYIIYIIFIYMKTTMIAHRNDVLHNEIWTVKERVEHFFVTCKYFRLVMQFLQAIKNTN